MPSPNFCGSLFFFFFWARTQEKYHKIGKNEKPKETQIAYAPAQRKPPPRSPPAQRANVTATQAAKGVKKVKGSSAA